GYDLKQLFIGTEGTLGVVTRAVLRLFPQQPAKSTALCAVRGFDETVALLQHLQARLGGGLSAFEAMWASYYHYVLDHVPTTRGPFAERHPLYVLIAAEGADPDLDRERLESALHDALAKGFATDAALAQSEREAQAFWAIRDG